MTLAELEGRWRALLLGKEEALMDGADVVRQRVYRRLVRGNLSSAIRRGIPIMRRLAGEDALDALIARFLDEAAPQTRLARFLPIEFAAWVLALPAAEMPHASAGELAQWETLEIDVIMAPDEPLSASTSTENCRDPLDSARIEMHPSARLAAYRYPVHTLTSSSTQWPTLSLDPSLVLAWRYGERFIWQGLDGGTAKLLVEATSGVTIGAALATIEKTLTPGDQLDRPRVRASLVDLQRRRAIVAFAAVDLST